MGNEGVLSRIDWNRATSLGAVIAAYAVAYLVLDGVIGNSVGILATFPVAIGAWWFGLRGGLLTALLLFPLNVALVKLHDQSLYAWLSQGGILGHGGLVVVGVVIGRQRDLGARLRQSEERSARLARTLEMRLGELESLNRLFQDELKEREDLARSYEALSDNIGKYRALMSLLERHQVR